MDVRIHNTVVVGSGAAGFQAADRLHAMGQTDVVLVTEALNGGTSRNTGSDKQTYYKLTLAGGCDSVRHMAQTLFDGQCVDGDLALCEAALSVPCFLHLAELGVPFPQNRWGEYVGYKTDHDPGQRATSVGPYTSREMTRYLEQAVRIRQIPIHDHMQVIRILTDGTRARGLLCLDTQTLEFVVYCCENILYATGGPAGMYADSVYPLGHSGATGLAFEAGVSGRNLTEWQLGLASVNPRWNVSGTYMQALPRFVSVDEEGTEREFLSYFFRDSGQLLTNVFLKGYQWPFDVRKLRGSSMIDILVWMERQKGRRVYLDYRTNPAGLAFDRLSDEARTYLEKAGACFGTPFQRLQHMNAPAVEFYRDKGIDLQTQLLEIALCVQHNNGGLAVDCWWQTDLPHFFAAGECAGTHGVCRPGGSALNAGQVGAFRAAQYIARHCTAQPQADEAFLALAQQALEPLRRLADETLGDHSNVHELWQAAAAEMSRAAGAFRQRDAIRQAAAAAEARLQTLAQTVRIADRRELPALFRLRDVLLSQTVYLRAMENYADSGGKSRGSALYTDPAGQKPYDQLPDTFTFVLDDGSRGDLVQEVLYQNGSCTFTWRPVRPIPEDDDFFENVWRAYRETGNID